MSTLHPDHFAAPGKTVVSAHDSDHRGTVVKVVGEGAVLVAWEGGLETLCYFDELDVPYSE